MPCGFEFGLCAAQLASDSSERAARSTVAAASPIFSYFDCLDLLWTPPANHALQATPDSVSDYS